MDVFKCLEFPNREFKSQTHMFMTLKEHETELIRLKKMPTWEASKKGQVGVLDVDLSKSIGTTKAFEMKKDFIYPVISTTRFMDTHKDVHLDGCFNRTIPNKQGKIAYILDHKMEYDKIIAWPEDVRMFKTMLEWGLVGKSFPGETEAMIFEISADAFRRKDVLNDILTRKQSFENSIRMNYHDIFLAINSNEKDLASNKALFDAHVNTIANKELAYELGHFYGVKSLEINQEGSLVVAGGSNSATSVLIPEPAKSTSDNNNEIDPRKGTQSEKCFYDLFLN